MKNHFQLIRSLEKKTPDPVIMQEFLAASDEAAQKLASVQLCLNLASYLEMLGDPDQPVKPHPIVLSSTEHFTELLKQIVLLKKEKKQIPEELCLSAMAQREANIHHMRQLSAYADRFTVYEYVLNRLEHRFSGKKLPDGYSDEESADSLLERLNKIKDKTARQTAVLQLIEQLPMRMTRKRFFQVMSDGFDVYKDSEKKTVDDLVYMIRTAAFLEEPERMNEDYPALDALSSELMGADYAALDAAGFEILYQKAKAGLEELNRQMDLVMLLQELLNETAVLALAEAREDGDASVSICMDLILRLLKAGKEGEISEEVYGGFSKLEGVQEEASQAFSELMSAYDSYSEACRTEIALAGLTKEFARIGQYNRLLSSSRFADTAEEEKTGKSADEAYILAISGRLYEELTEKFRSMPKVLTRAVMAKILVMFPLFIREYDELSSYFRNSLSSCSDEAEKIAFLEIADEILGA